jgi:lactam utilization protein B
VLAAMGVFHWWWLCNSGGCSGVVCSKSGADLQYDQETAIIILGVVKRTENAVDSLTGEWLELSADNLCIVIETNEDKKCNELVMTALRKQAHKIHTK